MDGKCKIIRRDEVAEKQDKVRRHNIAQMRLLAEIQPEDYLDIANEIRRFVRNNSCKPQHLVLNT